jgi:hypothetical protein
MPILAIAFAESRVAIGSTGGSESDDADMIKKLTLQKISLSDPLILKRCVPLIIIKKFIQKITVPTLIPYH